MTANFQWSVQKIVCLPQVGGAANVAHQVEWRCAGVQQENGQTFAETAGGLAGLPLPEEGAPFTPYESLTEQQVLQWLWDGIVLKDVTEGDVQARINNQINPPIVVLPLPWSVTRV